MRILFAGTEKIAVPALEKLAGRGLVAAVLTTPDAPGRRGSALLPSPVKAKALELGLPVFQPEHLRSQAREEIAPLSCDILLSFCYGKIFGPKFLALFDRCMNIHPSLLPRFRGCAPIQNAILSLDRRTGVSIQEIALRTDEGDIYLTQSFDLDGTETTESLEDRVSVIAASLADDLFDNLEVFKTRPQIGEPSYTAFVKKEDGRLDFSLSAAELHARIRAYSHWPRAVCSLDGQDLYLLGVSGSAFDIEEETCSQEPGTIVCHEKGRGFRIATGSGYLYVDRLQCPTKKACDSLSFLNGRRDIVGKVLT